MRNFRLTKGVTLMELMIVIAIVGILATIAYPSYVEHLTKSRRADGINGLMNLAARMERYYAENNTYATATIAAGNSATDVLSAATTSGGWYNLSITAQAAPTYTITATPIGDQLANDTLCANLTLNQANVRGISGTGTVTDCW